MKEIWKPALGFVGLYEVSNFGRVRSVPHKTFYQHEGKKLVQEFKGKILVQVASGHPYLRVTLSKSGKHFTKFVHRLVLESFVGSQPKNMQCRHLNGNPLVNRLTNLKWGTRLEDRADMIKHGRSLRGERHHQAKLTIKDVVYIKDSTERGLAKKFGVSRTQICRIKQGRSWTHVNSP